MEAWLGVGWALAPELVPEWRTELALALDLPHRSRRRWPATDCENDPGSIQTMSPAGRPDLPAREVKQRRNKQNVKGGDKNQIPPEVRVIHESRQKRRQNRLETGSVGSLRCLLMALLASGHHADTPDSNAFKNVHHFNKLLNGQIPIGSHHHGNLGIPRL